PPMRAWLPERQVYGPEPAGERDTEGLNRVFADAFTDRYRRDGLVGVRVPHLNPQVWRYALLDAGPGAMLWRDEAGHVVAFNIAHRSGAEGWMGPLAVRPDRQGAGVGKTIVRTALDWLLEQDVATLGLETMPRTVENIGFYARLGFFPGHLTVTLTNDIVTRGHQAPVLLSQRKDAAGAQALEAARRLVAGGYRVRWTDLRMTCEGYPEPHPGRGVLFSNWEIWSSAECGVRSAELTEHTPHSTLRIPHLHDHRPRHLRRDLLSHRRPTPALRASQPPSGEPARRGRDGRIWRAAAARRLRRDRLRRAGVPARPHAHRRVSRGGEVLRMGGRVDPTAG